MDTDVAHGMVVGAGDASHLGGYVPGGDVHTWYPDLWTWLVERKGVMSVLDVGCGEGHTLDYFKELGCYVLGVDGIEQPHANIVRHDYTKGPWQPSTSFDLAWSAEFVEHVEERYVANFMATFRHAELVLITHAVPGQGGWHHVNLRADDYWIGAMAANGYQIDVALTEITRRLAENEREPNYYRDTGLAFRRAR